jgi:hypothetical protein
MPPLHPTLGSSLHARAEGQNYGLNPSLVVGICILVAVFVCVVLAAVIRMCTKDTGPENIANLYRPYDPGQIERMYEVRRVNNKLAWIRGTEARREVIKRGRRMTQGYDAGLDWRNDPVAQVSHAQTSARR